MSYEKEAALAEGKVAEARAQGPAAEGRALAALARVHIAGRQLDKAAAGLAEAEARVHAAGQATDVEGKRAWTALRSAIADAKGRLESATGSAGRAADLFEEAARLAAEIGDAGLRADALLSLAVADVQIGKVLDAAFLAEEAEDLFVESGSGSGDIAARALADRVAATITENQELSEAADDDLEAVRTDGADGRKIGWRLRCMAAGFAQSDDQEAVEDAASLFQSAGAAFRAADSRSGEARSIRSEGACLARIGQLEDALEAFLEAAAIYAEIEAVLPQARTMLEAGHAARGAENDAKAADCYETAIKIFAERDSKFEEAFSRESLADLELEAGEAADARAGYEKAVALYEAVGESVDDQRAGCLMSLGLAFRELGNVAEAQKRFGQAKEMFVAMEEQEMVEECEKELKQLGKVRKKS